MARQLSEFEKEFAKARANKQKTFPWRGKVYTTEYKEEKTAREAKRAEPDLKMRTKAQEAADDAKIAAAMKKDEVKEIPAALPPLKKPESKPTPRTETKAAQKAAPEPKVESSLRTKSEPTLSDKEVKSYLKKNPVKAEPTISDKDVKDYVKKQQSFTSRIEPTMGRGGGGGGGMGGTLDPGASPKGLRREPKFAAGGSVKTKNRGDGCAVRGKTRGRII